jgi:hypothetical protein
MKLIITLNKDGAKENLELMITREQSIEIRRIMSENKEEEIIEFFKNIVDITGREHNIDFNEVESFELAL